MKSYQYDADFMIEAMKQFISVCYEYGDDKERDFEDEVYKNDDDIWILKCLSCPGLKSVKVKNESL